MSLRKIGTSSTPQKTYRRKSLTKTGAVRLEAGVDWRSLVIPANSPQELDASPIEVVLDLDNFEYFRARAVSSGEMHGSNDNGDYFPDQDLSETYKTFIGRGIYRDHNSESPDVAIGIITDAVWHPEQGFIEIFYAIDKNDERSTPVLNGQLVAGSMGVMVQNSKCSVCGVVTHNEYDGCDHLRDFLGKEFNGKKVEAINTGLMFYEWSYVPNPADAEALVLEKVAEKTKPFYGTFKDGMAREALKSNDYQLDEKYVLSFTYSLTGKKDVKTAESQAEYKALQTFVKDRTKSLEDLVLEIHRKRDYPERELAPKFQKAQDLLVERFQQDSDVRQVMEKYDITDKVLSDFTSTLEVTPYMKPGEGYLVGDIPRVGLDTDDSGNPTPKMFEAAFKILLQSIGKTYHKDSPDPNPEKFVRVERPELQFEIDSYARHLLSGGNSEEDVKNRLMSEYGGRGLTLERANKVLEDIAKDITL